MSTDNKNEDTGKKSKEKQTLGNLFQTNVSNKKEMSDEYTKRSNYTGRRFIKRKRENPTGAKFIELSDSDDEVNKKDNTSCLDTAIDYSVCDLNHSKNQEQVLNYPD